MTLSTHAVVGSLLGALASHNLVLAASAGFLSHFLMDSIPHWDYSLSSAYSNEHNPLDANMTTSGKKFYIDLLKIACDVALGLILVFLFFYWTSASSSVIIGAFVGAIFAMAPDPLQFVYWKFRHEPLISLQKFHLFMHAKLHLKDRPLIGVVSQIVIILLVGIIISRIFV